MPDAFILDKEKRFSESLLWELQNQAYSQFGPKAWSEKGVPFYVTSNPWTAKSYAHVVLGYLRDAKLDWQEPLYLFDLGAGTGRFAFFFLQEFLKLICGLPFEKLKFHYVMTDFAESNLEFWKRHPLLQPFFKEGILDFCLYHHTSKEENIKLLASGATLERSKIKNPLILLANYFFDTIPQDLFRVHNGKLEEGRITLLTKSKWKNRTDPELINHLEYQYSYTPIKSAESVYPDQPDLKKLLDLHEQIFDGSSFLFPIGAFQTLDYFQKLSSNKLLLIAGDQGVVTEEQVRNWGEPKLALHGSFSVAVSYFALAKYFEIKGGAAFCTSMPDPAFVVFTGALPHNKKYYGETNYAFKTFLDAFEPKDYWRLGLEAEASSWQLEEMLLLIKLGAFDPMSFNAFFGNILNLLPSASEGMRKNLLDTIEKVWERFYPIAPGDGAFAANLGVICFELGAYKTALQYFKKAVDLQGEQPHLIKNMGACYLKLNNPAKALSCFEKTVKKL